MVSPGSRSTPLVLAAAATDLPIWMVIDERSAGFVALGMAKASGNPVALICTSGSAAANYLPAVVEADRARTPLVLLTADRPSGHLARDAPQTIDQIGLYGSHVRAAINLAVAHRCDPQEVTNGTIELLHAARAPNAGPVHMNVPFARPLEPHSRDRIQAIAPVIPPPPPKPVSPLSIKQLIRFISDAERGLIVAGPGVSGPSERAALGRLSTRAGWPILADGMSGLRSLNHENLISTGDLLVRDGTFAADHRPDAILRLGATPTGSATQNWLADLDSPRAILDPDRRWTAPGPELVLRDRIDTLLDHVSSEASPPEWTDSWRSADEQARRRRRRERHLNPDTEQAVTASVLESEEVVWVASSMPVRHVDAMMDRGCDTMVLGNRGACGIDGTIASATGAALALGKRVTALVGDLAFLHDSGSLATARSLGIDLTIVVLDNGGGAIFESLPYLRSLREAGDEQAYARGRELFVTPYTQDLVAVAAGFGLPASRVPPQQLPEFLDEAGTQTGTRVLVTPSNPVSMLEAYSRLTGL